MSLSNHVARQSAPSRLRKHSGARGRGRPANGARYPPGGGMRSEGNPGETRRETYGGFAARHYNVRWLLMVG